MDGDRIQVLHPQGGPLMTKQSMVDETNANVIMERWINRGQFPRGAAGSPMYGDFSSGLDYREALDRVMQAEAEFRALPSRVRTACQNDPARFLELCSDPERLGELRELGLAEQDVPDRVVKVEVMNPASGPSPSAGGGTSNGS